ncbi:MAG: NUDIX hydrolase [Caldilineaceae bacterium]|nr:NUDIX hydrolase [Caldilineaceae bacterium]
MDVKPPPITAGDSGGTQPVTARRRYPEAPLVGVAAAVFNAAGEVLLAQRSRPPRAGSWGLPGGLLDLGETLEDGARREVSEECGVEVAIGGIAGVFEPITRDEEGRVEYHYVVIDYWATWTGGTPRAGDDAADVRWVALADLPAYALLPDSYAVVQRAHELWRQSAQGAA